MTDPLARFYVHQTTVQRFVSDKGGYGVVLATPVPVTGFVNAGAKLVRGAGGDQVVSTVQIAYPAGTPYIPGRSQIKLPDLFGGRTVTVIDTSVADAGALPTPNHIEIAAN